jgi:thiol-disulfide isomerase/thioredoxin
MKKLIIGLCLILATATSVFALGFESAKTQDKPIVIMFHQHGCSACRKFSPIFDKYASKFSNKFSFVKEDSGSQIASTLQFNTVPAIFILEPKTNSSIRITDDCAWDEACFTKTLNEYK